MEVLCFDILTTECVLRFLRRSRVKVFVGCSTVMMYLGRGYDMLMDLYSRCILIKEQYSHFVQRSSFVIFPWKSSFVIFL